MTYDYIEIGTSDFRTLADNPELKGISVEPVKEYFDELPIHDGSAKLNLAISSEPGMSTMHYVQSHVVLADGLPLWLRGCHSLGKPHYHVKKWCKDMNYPYEELVATQETMVWTLGELFSRFPCSHVDYLKIDTEGHDIVIMNHLADIWEDASTPTFNKIEFESNNLMNDLELEAVKARFADLGYSAEDVITRGNRDTILTAKYKN